MISEEEIHTRRLELVVKRNFIWTKEEQQGCQESLIDFIEQLSYAETEPEPCKVFFLFIFC